MMEVLQFFYLTLMSIIILNMVLLANRNTFLLKMDLFLEEKNPNKKYCNIFEVGFGTGLNAFLTYKESKFKSNTKLTYSSVEAHPLKFSEIKKLNYDKNLNDNNNIFNFIHNSEWNSPVQLSKNFTLIKNNSAIQNFNMK